MKRSVFTFLSLPVVVSLLSSPVVALLILPWACDPSFRTSPLFLRQKRDNGSQPYAHANTSSTSNIELSRRNLFHLAISSTILLGTAGEKANALPEQKSYSTNARNFDRLSSGDSSGGSSYNNSPTSASAAKRRAMVGCKNDSSRQEAMKNEGMKSLSEKECNLKVMDGDSEFMLKALKELDCQTCPYGIKGA